LAQAVGLFRDYGSALATRRLANSGEHSLIQRTLRLRIPCRRALLALAILPRSVFGPHDRSHGFQLRMSAACRARRSGVQPLLMAQPQ
jgi:hypothetical protein